MQVNCHIAIIVAAFIVLDILSGFSQAVYNGTVSSVIMRQGLFHKIAYVFAIALAILCEYGTKYLELNFTAPITLPVCVFICLTELISILENIGKLNPDIMPSLQKLFAQNKSRRANDE